MAVGPKGPTLPFGNRMPDNPPDQESRRFRRFPIDGMVKIYSAQAVWQVPLVDISLKGLLVGRPADWSGEQGQRFSADVRLEGGVVISMALTTIHLRADQIGFRCERIDMDSFSRLRRLVELNLGAPDLLSRELEALG